MIDSLWSDPTTPHTMGYPHLHHPGQHVPIIPTHSNANGGLELDCSGILSAATSGILSNHNNQIKREHKKGR
jgi:hypothetical protein